MNRKLIVTVPGLTPGHQEAIARAASAGGFSAAFYARPSEAIPHLADAEIIFSGDGSLPRHAPALRWLCTPSAGVNQFMGEGVFAAPDAMLSNSSGAYGTTIAEHIIMVTLELMRRQLEYSAIVSRREWRRDLKVRSIRGSRVTLLGTGDIGQEAAIRLRAFSPRRLVGVNRSGCNPGSLFDEVIPQDRLDDVLPDTDLLIMSLPGTAQTTRMMSRERLSLLPEDAFIVNVGRGNAIDQRALEETLRSGRLAGAALDVFETEPLPPEDSLWDCPRLLITPHCAGNTTLSYTLDRIVELFIEDLENYCAGRPLLRHVDRTMGY